MKDYDELGELNDFVEPVTASECFNKSLEYFERGKFDFALKYVNEAIDKDYFGTDVYLVRAQIYLELERMEDADADIATALTLDPYNSELLIWRSRTQAALSNSDEALKILNELIEVEPTNSEALISKAMIHYMESDFSKSEDVLKQIYNEGSGLPEQTAVASYWLAKIKQISGEIDQALEYFSSSLDLGPFFSYVYSDYADLLRNVKKLDESEEVYVQGLNLFPENAGLANDYANLLREMNRDDESIQYLQQAIKYDPELIPAYYNLGLSFQKTFEYRKSLKCFEKVVENSPEDSEARARLAESLYELRKYKQAYEAILIVIETEPENDEYLVIFSDIANAYLLELEKKQKWAKAIEIYISIFNTSIDIYKPGFNTDDNVVSVERLLRIFRKLEVFKPGEESPIILLQTQINIIRFNHALMLVDFIREKHDLNKHQIEKLDEIIEYCDSNIGVITEITKKLENESDSLSYFGHYLQAVYYWHVKDDDSKTEFNLNRALSLCDNMTSLLNVKVQFLKSRLNFRDAILTLKKISKLDRNAVWVYREIAKLYSGLRNFEAAIYYQTKYIHNVKNYPSSNGDLTKGILESASLWASLGNFKSCEREISRCKKYVHYLNDKEKKRMYLLEILANIETHTFNEVILKKIATLDSKIDPQTEDLEYMSKLEILKRRIIKKKDPSISSGISIKSLFNGAFGKLVELEKNFQYQNKRKQKSALTSFFSVSKTFEIDCLTDYFYEMLKTSTSTEEQILKSFAPLVKVTENVWNITHDLAHNPENIAYHRRAAQIQAISSIRSSVAKKDLEKVYCNLLILVEIFPEDEFSRLLLLYTSMLSQESFDYQLLQEILDEKEKIHRIRCVTSLGKFQDAEDLIYLENLDPRQLNYELARVYALWGRGEDALEYLENFYDLSKDKNLAESLAKSDFAFDFLKSDHAGFYRIFINKNDMQDDFEDSEFVINDDFEDNDEDNQNDTSIVLDLINELNKDLEELSDLENSNDSSELEKRNKSSDSSINNSSSQRLHEKSQTNKLDSSQDNSTDSDSST